MSAVYVNRTGDTVWSPNTKEQLCEAVEDLASQVAALRAQLLDSRSVSLLLGRGPVEDGSASRSTSTTGRTANHEGQQR